MLTLASRTNSLGLGVGLETNLSEPHLSVVLSVGRSVSPSASQSVRKASAWVCAPVAGAMYGASVLDSVAPYRGYCHDSFWFQWHACRCARLRGSGHPVAVRPVLHSPHSTLAVQLLLHIRFCFHAHARRHIPRSIHTGCRSIQTSHVVRVHITVALELGFTSLKPSPEFRSRLPSSKVDSQLVRSHGAQSKASKSVVIVVGCNRSTSTRME